MNFEELLGQMANEWMKDWNEAKGKIVRKLRKPYYQLKWKREVLSPKAVKERRENLIKAIKAGLIEEGLEKVDPSEWASDVIKGIENTEVTEDDAEKWMENVAPYMKVILEKKQEFDQLGLTGKQAMDWWYENVSKKLKNMKYSKREEKYKAKAPLIVSVE